MTKLIITEKPSVAKDIANVLGKFQTREGYMENPEYDDKQSLFNARCKLDPSNSGKLIFI